MRSFFDGVGVAFAVMEQIISDYIPHSSALHYYFGQSQKPPHDITRRL